MGDRAPGMPLAAAFAWVDETPVAAASLDPAHRAILGTIDSADTGLTGAVIKVQRPGIDAIVRIDLAALRRIGGWLPHDLLVPHRVDPPAPLEALPDPRLGATDYTPERLRAPPLQV
ncbi:AarF/UbiB family protein, partial [Clavibacter michiganensis]|uniref:AarF/UbiB family protein n=1 Tax=Clavibacter michiganensis TaxID=28447 RepID=UPI00292CBCA7